MLESSRLSIGPWTLAGGDPAGRRRGLFLERAIRDPTEGKVLGFVSWRRGLFWWLVRKKMAVYETEDASLVLTLWGPGWFRRAWEVLDAENRLRAMVFRTWLLDGDGQPLALLNVPGSGDRIQFMGPGGKELGYLQKGKEQDMILHFAKELDPFTRMALLGAALALGGE